MNVTQATKILRESGYKVINPARKTMNESRMDEAMMLPLLGLVLFMTTLSRLMSEEGYNNDEINAFAEQHKNELVKAFKDGMPAEEFIRELLADQIPEDDGLDDNMQ